MPLLTGRQLKKVFDYLCPFDNEGRLKPERDRVTILAANANMPLEVQARAYTMAAAQGKQSPIIIQLSHNALNLSGGASGNIKPIDGSTRLEEPSPLLEGAQMAADMIRRYADHYGARLVAISLDHFKVPGFAGGKKGATDPLSKRLALARIEDATVAMRPVFGPDAEVDDQTREAYAAYLCSAEYRAFIRDFLAVVNTIRPAWGMIDTEKLPPVLDFVVTREVSDAVRDHLGNDDMIIEAEFGATGTSGQAVDYRPLRGAELDEFARRVALFISYTGAEGIAYPIGMEHAAKIGEKHEPDVTRLKTVQGSVLKETGRYVPFAQHGGTGAAEVARGLVGKNNINTKFLVEGANYLADHVLANQDGIRAGEKDVCGTKIFSNMVGVVARAAVKKLEETGSYQRGPELTSLLKV